MSPYDAEQELQTIRTIMERTALYERAVAPVLTWLGAVGIVSAIATGHRSATGYLRIVGRTFAYASMLAYLATWGQRSRHCRG